MPERLLPFLAVVGVLTVLPGPDMALALRNAARGGSTAAWYTGLGCCTGLAVWAAATVGGLAALLAASGGVLDVLRVVGAAYLALLGLRALRAASGHERHDPLADHPHPRAVSRRTAYRQGLTSNLLNPKIALLFVSLLPQFVAPGEARTATTAALALAFVLVGLVWWRLFSLAVGFVGGAMARRRIRRGVEALAAAALLGLAARVAVG